MLSDIPVKTCSDTFLMRFTVLYSYDELPPEKHHLPTNHLLRMEKLSLSQFRFIPIPSFPSPAPCFKQNDSRNAT